MKELNAIELSKYVGGILPPFDPDLVIKPSEPQNDEPGGATGDW